GLSARASADGRNIAASSAPSRIRVVMPGLYGPTSRSVSRPANRASARPRPSRAIPAATPIQSGNPVKGSVALAGRCTAASAAPLARDGLELGLALGRLTVFVAVGAITVVVPLVLGEVPESEPLSEGLCPPSCPGWPGVGVEPHEPRWRWDFSACTSTSCPPEHGAAL